jgi:hypothetical protein
VTQARRFIWRDEDLEVVPPPYYVDPELPAARAWSTFRLPFEPKGNALAFRAELRAKIESLMPGTDQVIECVYQSADPSFVDAENVLIYNVGESCFAKTAAHGIRFERVYEKPPPCPKTLAEPGALHYVAYQTVAPGGEFTHWQRSKSIATWTDAEWPERASTSPTLFWLAIRHAQPQRIGSLREQAGLFGLRVTVTGTGRPIRPAKMIKPIFDAAISAFHVHNEPAAMAKATERLAARGHGDAATLGQLLTDPRFDLLGPRNLVAVYRGGESSDGVKWNPEDERCVAGELLWAPSPEVKRFSGELFEVLPQPA